MTVRRRFRIDPRESATAIFGVLGALLVANLLLVLLWNRPQARLRRELVDDSAPRVARLEARKREVEAIEAYLVALRKADEDLRHLRDDVLSTKTKKLIATQLEVPRIAEKFGIRPDRIQYENETFEREAVERLGITVPLEGGYANLRKFLQAVESSERFLVIEQVALAQGAEGGALLQLRITLATYFHAPELAVEPEAQTPARRRARRSA